MIKFQLQLFSKILGIGAASGIIYQDNQLYLISDNSGFLYKYDLASSNLYKFPLLENAQENIAKKDKPDFEAITLHQNKLYVFGSGSTKKRENRATFNLETKETKTKDVSKLYDKLRQKANFNNEDLNIEGSFYYNQKLYLINRGNSETAKNAIFVYDKINKTISFSVFKLPIINNVETTFTDAIVIANKIYFLACAENTTSTYLDGEIYGGIIGVIDLETLLLEKTLQISDNKKFEGLTLYSVTETEINFLLCEDNDSETLESNIYLLKITK